MVKNLKQKLLTGLTALTFSLAPGAVLAQDAREKPHKDYATLGPVFMAEPTGLNGGVSSSLRKSLTDNLGILINSCFFTDFTEKAGTKFDVSLSLGIHSPDDSAMAEFYLGPGFMAGDKYGTHATINIGHRLHHLFDKDGIYTGLELGFFLDKEGMYMQTGLGWRFE